MGLIAAGILAISSLGDGDEPIPFEVIIRAQSERDVRGVWALRPGGG